jgi:hypothetical protein
MYECRWDDTTGDVFGDDTIRVSGNLLRFCAEIKLEPFAG